MAADAQRLHQERRAAETKLEQFSTCMICGAPAKIVSERGAQVGLEPTFVMQLACAALSAPREQRSACIVVVIIWHTCEQRG